MASKKELEDLIKQSVRNNSKKPKAQSDRVVELLQDAIDIRIERNAAYGGAYLQHGEVVKALFPDGLQLDTAEDHGRFAILDTIIGKVLRYCKNFHNEGHDDSLKDIGVYSNMLRHLDEIMRDENNNNSSK